MLNKYCKTKEYFTNSNKHVYIDHTYIINLDKDTDRLVKVKKYLEDANITNYTKISGINGSELNINLLENDNIIQLNKNSFFNHNRDGRDSLKGSIGCALSHIKIWRRLLYESNMNNILILEDDVIIPTDFWDQFNKYTKDIPNNWDIIFCGGMRIYGKKVNENIIKGISYNRWFNCGLFGYVINKKSAKKLIELCDPVSTYIDIQMNAEYGKSINAYYIYPYIIKQNYNLPSSRIVSGNEYKVYNYNNDFKKTVDIIRFQK